MSKLILLDAKRQRKDTNKVKNDDFSLTIGEKAEQLKLKMNFSPDDYSHHLNLALFYLKENLFEKGKSSLEIAANLNNESFEIFYNLGLANEKLGNLKEAKADGYILKPFNFSDFEIIFHILKNQKK